MKVEEGKRGTDSVFFKLMKVGDEAILKLLNVKNPQDYEVKATVLKDKQLFPDFQAWPVLEKEKERVFIEFQGYADEMVRYRLTAKATLSCALDGFHGPVRMAIIFTEKSFQNKAFPLDLSSEDGKDWVKGEFTEIILEGYSEKKLVQIDPKLILLAPLILSKEVSRAEISKKGKKWVKETKKSYSKKEIKAALDVLSLFILHRFHHLNREEVINMLHLDISKSVAVQETVQLAREDERLKLIKTLMREKYKSIPRWVSKKLKEMNGKDLTRLSKKILSANHLEELFEGVEKK